MLIKFDGNKSKLNECIRNCDVANKLIKPESKSILFSIISTKLTDTAASLTNTREYTDWGGLKMY